tara:strand:+ start:1938 stop:2570 length:633 start_codon:yes stop_codon:yes gene_type:complete
MTSISYSILTHNETDSLEALLEMIVKCKDVEDEIVIVDDHSTEDTVEIIETYSSIHDFRYEQRRLAKDFAGQKNHLRKMCQGDYIFNLDADEMPHANLITNIKAILDSNTNVDLIWVPRVNTVTDMTSQIAMQWGWALNDRGWINYPDWQPRIHKNRSNIYWVKPVHERMVGYTDYSFLPEEEEWSLYHHKSLQRQTNQNLFYHEVLTNQ